jgi:predicted transcriptional regulator YheO
MNKNLMQIVLPRLARPLYLQLQKYQTGQLSDLQFSENFEELLQRQHHWLSQKGISAAKAAMTIHAAVLVLSQPGLRAEAEEAHLPLEVIEYRALREAAKDVAQNYNLGEQQVARYLSKLVASFGE